MAQVDVQAASRGGLTPRQIITAMSGLIVAMLLAQLDNMIVAPALPTIVGDLGGLSHLSWVVTGYILASTVSTPLWGKLGDLFGHKLAFMSSIVMFLAGSALCGMSQNMTELVLFRAFQGLGAGGLMVGVMSVIGMLLSPRERGKYMGIMMAVMPVSMIGGPLIGGFITDHLSWRWAFYVNLPLGLLALVVIWSTLHLATESRTTGKVRIDWWGSALLVTWLTSLVLAITWGGSQYAWGSVQIVSLLSVAVVGFVAFLAVERTVAEPVLPLHLFRTGNFSLSTVIGFVAGFGMFGGMTFLPQFQQFVQHKSATNSGLLLMPMMLGVLVCSLTAGQLTSRTGRYRAFPILGSALMAVGLYLFSTMTIHTGTGLTSLYMVILGAGIGCLMQTTNLIAQNSVELHDMGAATGAVTFTRNLGGSLGVSILGAVFANQLTAHLPQAGGKAAQGLSNGASSLTPKMLDGLPHAVQVLFENAVVSGITTIFLVAAVVTVVGFVASLFIKHVTLRGSGPAEPVQAPVEQVEEPLALV